jgi:hypothetical protein
LFSQDKTSADYWDQLHYALKYKIDKNFDEPPQKAPLEEYLYWIRQKGEDLKEVKEAFQELNVLYNSDPDNEVYKKWMNKFYYLVLNAEGSGNSTVTGAVMIHMRFECLTYGDIYIAIVRSNGRQIYEAAIGSGFDATIPREHSRCIINCAIGLLESDGDMGGSLYREREVVYGYLNEAGELVENDDLDFDNISCVNRVRFTVNVEGEPDKDLVYAFREAGEIIDECDWWKFETEKNTAVDLLIQYYKDALCKKPPHQVDMGHKFYRKLAQDRNLKEAVDYNNGFYGVLFGKVEVEESVVKKPAPGARVVVQSIDEKWETVADGNGEYRFSKAILHKHCSPFRIWAEYEGDRVYDEYRGILEEPDPNASLQKNLLIKSRKKVIWTGTIELEITETYNCDITEQTGEYASKRTIAGDHKSTLTDILIGMTDFDLPSVGNSIDGKLQYLSGQVTLNMSEDHTLSWDAGRTQCHNSGTGRWEWVSPGNWGNRHDTKAGQAYCDINLEETSLNLFITKKALADKSAVDNMQQELAVLQSRLQNAIYSKDMKAVEQIKGEMRNLAQGGQSTGNIPIVARIELNVGGRNFPVYTRYENKMYNVCLGKYEENESRAETLEMPILPPFGCQMEGMYMRGKNGNDRIDASIKDTQTVYKMFGSDVCPEATVTVSGSIYLERMKK